jgi:methionyl-tRNA formyltransferase
MLDEGVDSGPILASVEVPIPPDANSADLLKLLTSIGIELLNSTLSNFDRLNDEKRVQESSEKPRMTRKITRPDARLNFDQDYISLSNLVRAMNPEPVAWCEFEGTSVRILEAVSVSDIELPRGEARVIDSSLVVGCRGGALMLKIVQPAGKNAMDGADWFRGLRRESLQLS